jgi:ABC-type transport system involved in multi-copper enzyme maturation permease subunit
MIHGASYLAACVVGVVAAGGLICLGIAARRAGGLPVLGKELVEQSARVRTYVYRVVYAVALFLFVCLILSGEFRALASIYRGTSTDVGQVLGQGHRIFEVVAAIQFIGILIFLPAMTAGVITVEKERHSLSLLFLTALTPWQILLQKYLSRLVPMLTFLLLSLPVLAFAYSLGGLSADRLLSGVFLLFLTCLQVAAVALMFSAYCRTTASAFVMAYIGMLAVHFGIPVACLLLDAFVGGYSLPDEDVAFALFPIFIFFEDRYDTFAMKLWKSVPILLSIAACLLLARLFIVWRPFAPPRHRLRRAFQWLDRFWHAQNEALGGVVLLRGGGPLPGDEPIAWREVCKRSFGQVTHLIRLVLLITVPVGLIAIVVCWGHYRSGQLYGLSALLFVLWILACLLVSVKSANLIAAERSSQTLEVLLTTPLSGREIVLQKAPGVRRLIYALMVPMLLVAGIEFWWEHAESRGRGDIGAFGYAVSTLLALLIYLPMIQWVSFWIGLQSRKRSWAIVAALAAITAWVILPVVGLLIVAESLDWYGVEKPPASFLFLASPAAMLVLTEYNDFDIFGDLSPWVPILLNALWYAMLLWFFRLLCTENADKHLDRVPAWAGLEEPAEPPSDVRGVTA